MEMPKKNLIQNNIEKIKKSMKRLRDAINRSSSNNYRNMKLNSQNHYNIPNAMIPNFHKDNISSFHYNIKAKEPKEKIIKRIYPSEKNEFINISKKDIPKSPPILNNKKNLKKKIIDKSYKENNLYNFNFDDSNEITSDINSPLIPSRNRYIIDINGKTDNLKGIKLENNDSKNTPKLTDISSKGIKEEENLFRNKSSKQIDAYNNIISKNNDYSLYSNDLNLTENSLFNINSDDSNNIINFENYLNNQINIFDGLNKELLIRYKNFLKKFKTANIENKLLINKINELQIKQKNINNINLELEKEYNNTKEKILKNNNKQKLILLKKNEELKNKIYKYDELLLNLKNQINKINEENEKNISVDSHDINYDVIINDLENKIEYYYKELNKQEEIIKINKISNEE